MNVSSAAAILAPYAGLPAGLERAQSLVQSARTIAFGGLYNDISKAKFRQGADMAHEAALLIAQASSNSNGMAELTEQGSRAMAIVADRDLGWIEAVGQATQATQIFDRVLDRFNTL